MQVAWLSLAVACTFGYHLVLKLTPAGANPLLSLLVTYALVVVLFSGIPLVTPGGFERRQESRQLNWTALALAAVVVGLDLRFLFLYRSGFEISLGALVTQSAAALLLLATGVATRVSRASLGGHAIFAGCNSLGSPLPSSERSDTTSPSKPLPRALIHYYRC